MCLSMLKLDIMLRSQVVESKPIVDDFVKAIDVRKLKKLNSEELTALSKMLDKIN